MKVFAIRTVVGRNNDGSTAYAHNERSVREDLEEAIEVALDMPGTKDVFDVSYPPRRVVRVHVDGGCDFEPFLKATM